MCDFSRFHALQEDSEIRDDNKPQFAVTEKWSCDTTSALPRIRRAPAAAFSART